MGGSYNSTGKIHDQDGREPSDIGTAAQVLQNAIQETGNKDTPNNILITGARKSGKTTVVQKTVTNLEEHDLSGGGVYCPEINQNGERVGYEIVDILTGTSEILAHVDQETGPSVGKYRVNIRNVDTVCDEAFPQASEEADFLVVDEIGPMAMHSEEFKQQVERALNRDMPLVAVIDQQSTTGFIDKVQQRDDTIVFEVTEETRDELPETLTECVLEAIK